MNDDDRIKHRCTECGTESLCTPVEKLYSDRIECLKWACDGEMKPVEGAVTTPPQVEEE